MSRIGDMPVPLPDGTSASLAPGHLTVRGPKGELSVPVPEGVGASLEGTRLRFTCARGTSTALQGLTRALANNCVTGVTKGFSKRLEIVGVGYRARMQGRVLVLQLGYSHPVEVLLPDGIEAKVERNTKIEVSGIDKQLVGQTAANIRALRKPDPYKQKGVRYEGERLRSKEGKSGAA
ncbi:MAG: 50S ribosomal protein L6 [Bryobacterales bacterium]|nr:50S ribosomal protein L6 [Bryobacterales bacterium]